MLYPENEDLRIAALRRYRILDSRRERIFDNITRIASAVAKKPIAVMNFIDSDRQWYKSSVGIRMREMSRSVSFCPTTILTPEPLIIPDALKDERFKDDPVVVESPGFRFYAGTPLVNPEGHNLGTLCVLDLKPGAIQDEQMETLRALAEMIIDILELRIASGDLARAGEQAVFFENIVKAYVPRGTWSHADESAGRGELLIPDRRMELTFLFMDAKGFTAFSEEHQAEQVIAVLNDYYDPVIQIIGEQNGDIDKFIGDSVFAVFADPREALRAAVRIRDEIAGISGRRLRDGRPVLSFRIGMNIGDVVRGNVGNYLRQDYTMIGDAVNIASRLESACEPGGILISDNLYQRVREFVRTESSARVRLKGKSDLLRVHYVSGLREA